METTATSSPLSSGAVMQGKVHGGNNPVSTAAVLLYIVGQSGVGSAPTLLAQTTTANDGTGSFQFTKNPGNVSTLPTSPGSSYQCPTGADPLLYIYSAGGNTTGNPAATTANNTAAAFLAPVGYCSQVSNSTFVDVSEVTTVATVAAVAQFINPNNDGIGNDGILVAYQAMGNAFKTIPNLVNQATGIANATTTIAGSGTGTGAVSMTVTAPTATVNTIANILTACVNQLTVSSGTNCSTLFANAIPPSNPARESQPTANYNSATDTIQAALYMFLNPTDGSASNRTNLFNLSPAGGAPFQPQLSAAPSDWILPVTYSTTSTCGTGSSYFSHPYSMSVDSNGNIWFGNKAGTNGGLVEMSPYGQPVTCVTLGGSSTGVVVDSGYGSAPSSIWYVDAANNLIWAYPTSGGSNRSFSTAATPIAIAADGNGNIFFTTSNGTTSNVYELVGAANPSDFTGAIQITNQSVGPNPASIFPDSAGDLWVSSGAGYVTELQQTTAAGNVHGFVPIQYSVVSPSYGLIVGPANKVYVTSQDTNSTFSILTPTTNSYSTATFTGNVGGLSTPTGIWLDGAQNSWIGNSATETSGLYGLSQIGPNGGSLSPNGTNGGYQFASTYLNAARSTVVDTIGNVWVVNDNNANSVTQFLGAAVPIYAPYAAGIANGRFQTIP